MFGRARAIARRNYVAAAASADATPTVATSQLLRMSQDASLATPGLIWRDPEEEVRLPLESDNLARDATGSTGAPSKREVKKMNLYQAVRDAMQCVPRFANTYCKG